MIEQINKTYGTYNLVTHSDGTVVIIQTECLSSIPQWPSIEHMFEFFNELEKTYNFPYKEGVMR